MSDSNAFDLFQRAREIGAEGEDTKTEDGAGGEDATQHEPTTPSERDAQPRLGDYELLEVIGRGGFGGVYRARDAFGREVAIKVLLNQNPKTVERFRREAKAIATLNHPNVLRIHSAEFDTGQLFLVTELVPGCSTLDEALSSVENREAGLRLILAAASGLGHAHEQGLTHRDVKPSNLLVGSDGRVRVADFGLVLAPENSRLTQTGGAVGTPRYMAPEQLAAQRDRLGPPCDVWGLGVILYRFLCDVFPFPLVFNGDPPVPPREHDPTISSELERICLRALAPDPQRRYPDAGAFARDLERALQPSRFWAPKLLAVAAALGLFLLTWLAGGLVRDLPSPTPNTPAASTPTPTETDSHARRLRDPLAPPVLAQAPSLRQPPAELLLPFGRVSPQASPQLLEQQVTQVILWGGASEAYRRLEQPAIKQGKPRGDHLLQRGRLRLELGRYAEARSDFMAFVRRSPRDGSYRGLGLAMTCLAWGVEGNRGRTLAKGAEAIEAIGGVHPSFLRLPELYAQIVRAYLLVEAPLEAQQVLAQAQAIFSGNPLLCASQGSVYVAQGLLNTAWKEYAKAVRRGQANRAHWLCLRSEARLAVGANAEAALDLESALRAPPPPQGLWFTLLARSKVRLALGQLDAAEADLAAIAAGPPSWRVSALRARLALARGKPHAALPELELAERLSPGRTSLLLTRARLAWQLGRYEACLASIDALLAKGIHRALRGRAHALRAFALGERSRATEACADARRALELLLEPERRLRGRLEALIRTKEESEKEK